MSSSAQIPSYLYYMSARKPPTISVPQTVSEASIVGKR